ncbi:MAG TPA: radical SAM protein [Anaeromyxobacteraceae bacterium]|nr:radical SAM protein [Anaeromyxobacteraceae bacterium]
MQLNHRKLYRLPWSPPDNILGWLEPTKQCNLVCEGCYSTNNAGSHKSIDRIRQDLDIFERYRQIDAISIAGGDPLTHPEILEIVRMVAQRGFKPILNTNGLAMTANLLRDLKAAGLLGVTFHVDSLQRRPGWTGKTEGELNGLRQQFADLVAEVGGVSCAFNATVFEKTLAAAPEIVAWAQRNPSKVQLLVFIAFRTPAQAFDYYVGPKKIEPDLIYDGGQPEQGSVSSTQIASAIAERFPAFQPAAYLNGTEQPDALKWLMTLTVNDGEEILGCLGSKAIELLQVVNHLWKGRYLGYVGPGVMALGRSILALGVIDEGLRGAARRWASKVARNPRRLVRPLHVQSVMIIQPVDFMPDGRTSMCDGCPDVTVHEGELVWSCRLEERLKFGQWVRPLPRTNGDESTAPAAT